MNENLEQALVELINKAGSGADFLAGEIPEVVIQLLAWRLFEHTVGFVILTGVCLTLIVLIKRWHPGENSIWNNSEQRTLNAIACSIVVFFFGVFAVVELIAVFKIIISPKAYLIEDVAKLISKS